MVTGGYINNAYSNIAYIFHLVTGDYTEYTMVIETSFIIEAISKYVTNCFISG